MSLYFTHLMQEYIKILNILSFTVSVKCFVTLLNMDTLVRYAGLLYKLNAIILSCIEFYRAASRHIILEMPGIERKFDFIFKVENMTIYLE